MRSEIAQRMIADRRQRTWEKVARIGAVIGPIVGLIGIVIALRTAAFYPPNPTNNQLAPAPTPLIQPSATIPYPEVSCL